MGESRTSFGQRNIEESKKSQIFEARSHELHSNCSLIRRPSQLRCVPRFNLASLRNPPCTTGPGAGRERERGSEEGPPTGREERRRRRGRRRHREDTRETGHCTGERVRTLGRGSRPPSARSWWGFCAISRFEIRFSSGRVSDGRREARGKNLN